MTDQEKIKLLTDTVVHLQKHVGLFMRGEIDRVLQQVKESGCECQAKDYHEQVKCPHVREHYHNDNLYCIKLLN